MKIRLLQMQSGVRPLHATRRLLIALALPAATLSAEPAWPVLKLPDELLTFSIAEKITVNGMPMRLRGFVSDKAPGELLKALHATLGEPLVESRTRNKIILGRAQGDHYITIDVAATPNGSRGTVAVADIAAMTRNRDIRRDVVVRTLERLPAGSTVASDISCEDGGKSARHLMIMNNHDEARNRDALLALMTEDGYRVEREVVPDAAVRRNLPPHMAAASTIYFAAPGKEAIAVIARTGDGTSIILNTTSALQAYR